MSLNVIEFYWILSNFIEFYWISFDFIELYFNKLNFSITSKLDEKYHYFLGRISDTKKFNLDYESLFMEFEEQILNG